MCTGVPRQWGQTTSTTSSCMVGESLGLMTILVLELYGEELVLDAKHAVRSFGMFI